MRLNTGVVAITPLNRIKGGQRVDKQELIEALNQADIMLRPVAIIVNRKTAENIREEIPDFEKYTRLMANALTEVFEDARKF